MLEILQFIFENGWHFFGSAFLLMIIAAGIGSIRMFNTTIIHEAKEKSNKEY